MTKILISILALCVFVVCAYNTHKLMIQAESSINHNIAWAISITFSAILTQVFVEGQKRFRSAYFLEQTLKQSTQRNGLMLMGFVLLFEVFIGFFNVFYAPNEVVSMEFEREIQAVANIYNAKTDSMQAVNNAQIEGFKRTMKRLDKGAKTKKSYLNDSINKVNTASISQSATFKTLSLTAQNLKETELSKTAQGEKQVAVQAKKTINTVLAFANLLLYFFIVLLSSSHSQQPQDEPKFLQKIRAKFNKESDLLAQILCLNQELERLRPLENCLESAKISLIEAKEELQTTTTLLEDSRKETVLSRNKVESISKILSDEVQNLKKAQNLLTKLENSILIYCLAPFTINNSEMIYLRYEEGIVKHKAIGKSNWQGTTGFSLKLSDKLGLAQEPKPKKEKQTKGVSFELHISEKRVASN